MPCDTRLRTGQSLQERIQEVESSLNRLKRYLTTGSVRIQIGPQGSVAFVGWNDRDDLTDLCAYRSLAATNSWELRQAVMKAEQLSGRKINPNAINAGYHTHDGKNWQKH